MHTNLLSEIALDNNFKFQYCSFYLLVNKINANIIEHTLYEEDETCITDSVLQTLVYNIKKLLFYY